MISSVRLTVRLSRPSNEWINQNRLKFGLCNIFTVYSIEPSFCKHSTGDLICLRIRPTWVYITRDTFVSYWIQQQVMRPRVYRANPYHLSWSNAEDQSLAPLGRLRRYDVLECIVNSAWNCAKCPQFSSDIFFFGGGGFSNESGSRARLSLL